MEGWTAVLNMVFFIINVYFFIVDVCVSVLVCRSYTRDIFYILFFDSSLAAFGFFGFCNPSIYPNPFELNTAIPPTIKMAT